MYAMCDGHDPLYQQHDRESVSGAKRMDACCFGRKVLQIFDEIAGGSAGSCDLKRDNANINGDAPMGAMLQQGANTAKEYYLETMVDPEIADLHRKGWIHIHDLDFYGWTTTCTQIELRKLFKGGFNTGHGHLREPKSIGSYAALAAIAIQSNQNDQHGGQSIVDFDYAMGDGVRLTYQRYLREGDELWNTLREGSTVDDHWLTNFAMRKTIRDTYQAMEGLVHNLNTMHSRAGAQVPFSSINYGMDTSWEGRLAMKQLLLATEAGLGDGETPIFPIQIFRVKEGVNYNPGDPNYDLFRLAMQVSAKRLFPNFSFVDAPFNLQYYKPGHPETEVAYMGCRTRVMGNVCGPEIAPGRGNLSFTSINLPRLAIEAHGDTQMFFTHLNNMLSYVMKQLLERFKVQAARLARNFPFLMGEGVWLDSETLQPDDPVLEVLRHGTLSIGFIGLAETLKALTGHHHGESEEAQKLGLEIVGHIRDFCDDMSEELGLNFTCLATPAEGLSGRFVRMDKKRYGEIPGVTDKDYYTNSFHVPVYFPISAARKIELEAPYHALTNAGHISYVEMDGDPTKNLEAFEAIIRHMKECGIGYGSINHPVDRDPVCGYNGIIGDVCPCCGRHEHETIVTETVKRMNKEA